jgi:hypothetical protein
LVVPELSTSFTEPTFVVVGTLPAHCSAFMALAGEERAQFVGELERLTTSWAAFKSSRIQDVKWCHPKLVVEVKHLAGSKTLRHATMRNFTR